MRPRTRLLQIQRSHYARLKRYAHDLLGSLSPELRKYFLEYKRNFPTFEEVSSKRELVAALHSAHLVVCGDYHTLGQAQRTVIRLLRDSVETLTSRKKRIILALEMATPRDKAAIASFLAGKSSEKAFLRNIQFHESWGFPWRNYRRLFQFARDNRIEVVGINLSERGGEPSLKARDQFMAGRLADLSERDDVVVIALVGDLHLASKHLPGALKTEIRRRRVTRNILVIHQNNELFYWQLAERGLEHLVDVVKVRKNEFCVMNTPPWVKLKSQLEWTELMADRGSFSPRRKERENVTPSELDAVDYTDEIRELVGLLQAFLGINGPVDDDFSISTPTDLSFVNRISRERRWPKAEIRRLAQALTEYESLFIAGQNIIFLSSLNRNHAASGAAFFLHAKISGRTWNFRNVRSDFYPQIWVEALGFFGSCVINHKRKCNGPTDLERVVREAKSKGRRARLTTDARAAELAVGHLQMERKFLGKRPRVKKMPYRKITDVMVLRYRKAATLLGQLLGYALYSATMQNKVSREEIHSLFENAFSDAAESQRLYFAWARRLDEHKFRDVTKFERL